MGRSWISPAGNLYASTIVRLRQDDPSPTTLALVAGVALHRAVAEPADAVAALRLKWPNDLMADGAKLAGILIERVDDAAVIGFGVNLAHAPRNLDRPCTSLAALGIAAASPQRLVETLAELFAGDLVRWRRDGIGATRAEWLERAHPLGTPLTVTVGDRRLSGTFGGLETDGALRLIERDGEVRVIRSGDVWPG